VVRFARILLLLVAGGALAFRLPCLDNRPMHGDEAVHAFKFRELWEEGSYRYDPREFHGPTLYYATLPAIWLSGVRHFEETNEGHYRIVTVGFGAALVLLLALFWDGLGGPAVLCAGTLLALSPAFVFYSRYYIQETLLAFFTLALLGLGWRSLQSRHPGWLLAAGTAAGLMLATKETALLSFGAAAIAGFFSRSWRGPLGQRKPGDLVPVAGAVVAALFTASLFLSGFFRNPAGLGDSLRAYGPWLQRAGETDLHRHPWHYYLGMLAYTHRMRGPVWSEGFILGLALAGGMAACGQRALQVTGAHPGLLRFLGLYTVALTTFYSLIPYKTPWCLLNFLEGMVLLAGVGAWALVRLAPGRGVQGVVGLLLLGGGAHLAWLSYQTSFVYPTDGRNPYAYAQPVPDVVELGQRVKALASVSPQGPALVVKVFSADEYYWPLPWYLRGFPKVGYWTEVPADPAAPVVIASPQFGPQLERRLGATHQRTGYYGLRPTVVFEVWVHKALWQAFLESRSRIRPAGRGTEI
jgi:uncharacterized protein (TIGR03663 family)